MKIFSAAVSTRKCIQTPADFLRRQARRVLPVVTVLAAADMQTREVRRLPSVCPHPDTEALPEARTHGCCAVIGKICWFCHDEGTQELPLVSTSPEGMRPAESAYGYTKQPWTSACCCTAVGDKYMTCHFHCRGLPILYHVPCAEARTMALTAADITAAYKEHVAAGGLRRYGDFCGQLG